MGKWLWRFVEEQVNLWRIVIQSKFGEVKDVGSSRKGGEWGCPLDNAI